MKKFSTTGIPRNISRRNACKGQKIDKQILIFWTITILLAIALIFICTQNMTLKNEIQELEKQSEIKIGESINDFMGVIIEKIDTCFPVQIVSRNKSAIILGTQCLEKR